MANKLAPVRFGSACPGRRLDPTPVMASSRWQESACGTSTVWQGSVRSGCTARSALPASSGFNCSASLFPQQSTVDKLIKKTNLALVVGTHSWRDQFMEAITVSAGEGDIGKPTPVSAGFVQPGMRSVWAQEAVVSAWSAMLSCCVRDGHQQSQSRELLCSRYTGLLQMH